MRNRTTNKAAVAFTSIVCFIIFVALAFIVTSLVMASVNDRSLVDEWKSWGTAIEEAIDDTDEETKEPTEDNEQTDDSEEADNASELVSNGESGTVDVQSLADNYSNVVIAI